MTTYEAREILRKLGTARLKLAILRDDVKSIGYDDLANRIGQAWREVGETGQELERRTMAGRSSRGKR